MRKENSLWGKSIYAFGDSIVYGHTMPEKCFMRIIAEENGAELTMCAVNGASILPGENHILTQVENAPGKKPDLILFDGYTNDAYERFMDRVDNGEFRENFEKILQTMREKWPGVPIVYVTIHKSCGRDWEIQSRLREIALEACGKYEAYVVDVFRDAALDTRDRTQLEAYIIGQAGSHPNEAACRTYYVPLVLKTLTEILV